MVSEEVQRAVCVFLTGYAKRWMEGRYDALMRADALRPVLQMGATGRYGIEAALYALNAVLDRKWDAPTPLQSSLKEIVMDAPSEIGKRLVNGFRDHALQQDTSPNAPDRYTAQKVLLSLDDKTLRTILEWYATSKPDERSNLLQTVIALTPDELTRMATLSQDQASLLKEFCATALTGKKKKDLPPTIRSDLDSAKERLRAGLARRSQ